MIHDLPKFVRFLCRHGITAHEFMLPYMLYLDEKVEVKGITKYPNDPSEGTAVANLYRYTENVRGWTPNEVSNLERKGLIENTNPIVRDSSGEYKTVSPDLMSVTDLFCEEIFAPETRWDEFLAVYPTSVPNFNDPRKPNIPLKMVTGPGAMEALENFYLKVVKTNILHNQVIELTKWASEEGYINMNISKYVASKYWEVLKKMRQEKVQTPQFGLKKF